MDYTFVYITAPTREEAEKIGRVLVNERLAACVNIIPGMRSIYHWQGKVEQAQEVVVIAKTRAALFEKLAKRVRDLHSYTCPCIISLPISAGEPTFLNWINEYTTDNAVPSSYNEPRKE